jgi:hypothetical protein
MIHVSELGAEYFQHNEVLHELRGERTGRRFRLYDSLVVQVARVDLDARRIEFQLVPSMVRATKVQRDTDRDETGWIDQSDEEASELDMPKWLAEALAEQGKRGGKGSKKATGKTKAGKAGKSRGKGKDTGLDSVLATTRSSKTAKSSKESKQSSAKSSKSAKLTQAQAIKKAASPRPSTARSGGPRKSKSSHRRK